MGKSNCLKFMFWLDILGPSPNITHKGETRYKSIFGSLLSIISFIICILPDLKDLADMIYGYSPTIDSIEKITGNGGYFVANITYENTQRMKLFFQIEYFDSASLKFKSINNTELPIITMKLFNETEQLQLNKEENETANLVKCPNDMFNNYGKYLTSKGEYFDEYDNKTKEIQEIQETSLCFPSFLNERLFERYDYYKFVSTLGLSIDQSLVKVLQEKYNTTILNLVINYSNIFVSSYDGLIFNTLSLQKIQLDNEIYQEVNIEIRKNIYIKDDSKLVLELNSSA